jgi:succinate dehydrogenase hydrophobic anchor subunit
MLNFTKFKKFFLSSLVGSLIISAFVAVVTVLTGEFSEITWKVLLTLLMVVFHSLISLSFIWDDEKKNTFDRFSFFSDVLFTIVVASFITSRLNVWKIIPSELAGNFYQTYFVIGFASLHSDILSKILKKETYMDMIVYANYFFMALVVLMLQAIIYVENSKEVMGEMFFRILGATTIVDGTLSVLAIIFYKLYTLKHPKAIDPLQTSIDGKPSKKTKRGMSFWVWLVVVYLLLRSVISFLFFAGRSFSGF